MEMTVAVETMLDDRKVIVAPQGRLFRSHPRYGWVGATGETVVKFITDDDEYAWTSRCDEDGYRVLGLPRGTGRKVWLFGCSNTFGFGLPVERTFAHRLQALRPDWAVRNFGLSGYGTGQMVLQFMDEMRKDKPDDVVFLHLHEHHWRTVAALEWVKGVLSGTGRLFDVAPTGWPRVGLTAKGGLSVTYVPFKDLGIESVDQRLVHHYARPEEWYVIQVTAKIFTEVQAAVRGAGARFHLAHFQRPDLAVGRAMEAGIPTIDLSAVDRPEFTLRPFDAHPNAEAHAHFAERILGAIEGSSGATR